MDRSGQVERAARERIPRAGLTASPLRSPARSSAPAHFCRYRHHAPRISWVHSDRSPYTNSCQNSHTLAAINPTITIGLRRSHRRSLRDASPPAVTRHQTCRRYKTVILIGGRTATVFEGPATHPASPQPAAPFCQPDRLQLATRISLTAATPPLSPLARPGYAAARSSEQHVFMPMHAVS